MRVDYTTTDAHVMIGISPTSVMKENSSFYGVNGSITYYLRGFGYLYQKGNSTSTNFPTGMTNTVIKVITDLISNKVSFYFEDMLIQTVDLDASFAPSNDYYPFVELYTTYDRVSFISYKEQ